MDDTTTRPTSDPDGTDLGATTGTDETPAGTPTDPQISPNPWPRRIFSLVGLLVAGAIFAYGCNVGQRGEDDTSTSEIVAQYPAPNGRALRQTEVGADLIGGYDGRLTVNGIDIPEDQMEGAIDPSKVSEADLRQYGIRPQNRNRVIFRPGPGKVIEEFEQGEITIALRYFPDRKQESAPNRTVTWTVTVT